MHLAGLPCCQLNSCQVWYGIPPSGIRRGCLQPGGLRMSTRCGAVTHTAALCSVCCSFCWHSNLAGKQSRATRLPSCKAAHANKLTPSKSVLSFVFGCDVCIVTVGQECCKPRAQSACREQATAVRRGACPGCMALQWQLPAAGPLPAIKLQHHSTGQCYGGGGAMACLFERGCKKTCATEHNALMQQTRHSHPKLGLQPRGCQGSKSSASTP
ncbi:hypothetical protein COO60DRAFT_1054517 [Scenedesmus sp. NREL 46B-D3]|nr:hypothetical protein COO60DRAFT_1054517 [Scenedesmus sp. NREL 46B-D3]